MEIRKQINNKKLKRTYKTKATNIKKQIHDKRNKNKKNTYIK